MNQTQTAVLRVLEINARTPVSAIAAQVGATEADVETLIEDAQKNGVIRSHRTRIDWERAGQPRVFAFIDVSAQPERGSGYDRIAERIYRYPEVHSVYLVSGTQDLRVVVEGETIQAVANFVAERVATIDGVRGTQTNFLLKKYKEDGVLFTGTDAEDGRLPVTP